MLRAWLGVETRFAPSAIKSRASLRYRKKSLTFAEKMPPMHGGAEQETLP